MVRTRTLVISPYIGACFLLGICCLAYADSAEVLPKGVFRTSVEGRFYLPITERFDPHGHAEPLAVDYNAVLNSNIFPGLKQLETALRLPAGSANIGTSVVSFKLDLDLLYFSVQYGITDRLSAGIRIPYFILTNHVKARIDPTNATVGKNTTIDSLAPLPAKGVEGPVPGIPGRTQFITTEDVRQLLGQGLDINGNGTIDIPGFGFKRFETWSGNGIGDIDVEARYQYLKTKNWRLAFTGGVRFPTGRTDDPDNLVDFGFGTGAYALLFRVNNDYTGVKNLVLNGTFRYDLNLPDKQTKRVPDDVTRPVTANKERVSRDLGDVFDFEVSGTYNLPKGVGIYGLYEYTFALKDRVSGNRGFTYQSLEAKTNYTSHIVRTGVFYTTLPLYLERKFPVPVTVGITYRTRFAGTNNTQKAEYFSLELAALF